LAIDLMHPKQPAAPPNPVRRWSLIGALAAVSLGIVGYFLWSDVQVLRKDVEAAEDELGKAEQMAAKLQEKADETRFVQQWLGDQVDWLDQLQRLSRQFPDGQGANVRRLSAKLEGEYGVFDLSIQVSDPSRVAALENRLRSADFAVTSEQISEQAANAEYPWQFEARVAFPLEPLAERERDFSLVAGASLEFPGADEASQETLASGTAASAGAAGEGDSASGPADPATDGSEAATQPTPDDPPAANDGGPAS
jgi:Tfp pilus assembly protein PilN